jgi:hypothetical protein
LRNHVNEGNTWVGGLNRKNQELQREVVNLRQKVTDLEEEAVCLEQFQVAVAPPAANDTAISGRQSPVSQYPRLLALEASSGSATAAADDAPAESAGKTASEAELEYSFGSQVESPGFEGLPSIPTLPDSVPNQKEVEIPNPFVEKKPAWGAGFDAAGAFAIDASAFQVGPSGPSGQRGKSSGARAKGSRRR